MIELFLCSVITVLPDFLYRRYVQGKKVGTDITLYSVWFELRYGITACLFLTLLLLTVILYFHPSTSNAVSFYRTVPILPESSGRVEEVLVGVSDKVKAGQPTFKLNDSTQKAALDTAQRKLAEVDAAIELAKSQLVVSDAQISEAESAYRQAVDELATRTELKARNSPSVAPREIERLQNVVDGRQAAVAAAIAGKQTISTQIATVLPAQQASATAQVAEAQVALDKTTVHAGIDGIIEQFTLRKGDIVNPLMRPAGVLVPSEAGRWGLIAGFNQLEAQVMKPGMVAEATCVSKPMTVIPMVVTNVQDLIATGQVRASDQLIDAQQVARPGTLTVYLEPLFDRRLRRHPARQQLHRQCLYQQLRPARFRRCRRLDVAGLHGIDAVGVVHAIVLRIQALVLPIQTLVFSGGH